MSWLIAYLMVAAAGLIIVLAMFKVGRDADAAVPAIPPEYDPGERAELQAAVTASLEPPPTDRASADLEVVEAGSIDLYIPVENDDRPDEVPASPSLPVPAQGSSSQRR
jgi:hypothetical protein